MCFRTNWRCTRCKVLIHSPWNECNPWKFLGECENRQTVWDARRKCKYCTAIRFVLKFNFPHLSDAKIAADCVEEEEGYEVDREDGEAMLQAFLAARASRGMQSKEKKGHEEKGEDETTMLQAFLAARASWGMQSKEKKGHEEKGEEETNK